MKAGALAGNLIQFARYLRGRGLSSVVPQTSGELLRAAEAVGLSRRDDVYHAFRAVTVSRPEEIPIFDEAFHSFFGGGNLRLLEAPAEEIEIRTWRVGRAIDLEGVADEEPEDSVQQVGASAVERLWHRDFGELTPEELDEMRRLIARMVWKPAETRSRRWAPADRGRRPDMRRTFRGALGPEGDLLQLAMSRRLPRRRPLLILADVSGSMERYVEMFLYFAHAARGRLGRVEAFVFSTRLTNITRELRRRDPRLALRDVSGAVDDWSGGTRIGDSLRSFNETWSRRVARGGPVALVISDGWDCGDPDMLRNEMARFARSVYRVVWLNPLAGRPGYLPETRGMRAVLPFVDDFLSASNLGDLATVVDLLESVPARRRELSRA